MATVRVFITVLFVRIASHTLQAGNLRRKFQTQLFPDVRGFGFFAATSSRKQRCVKERCIADGNAPLVDFQNAFGLKFPQSYSDSFSGGPDDAGHVLMRNLLSDDDSICSWLSVSFCKFA